MNRRFLGFLALSLAGVLGIATYDARDRALLREKAAAQREQERMLKGELASIQREIAQLKDQGHASGAGNEELSEKAAEVHKLRDQATRLRNAGIQNLSGSEGESTEERLKTLLARSAALKGLAERFPEHAIPELELLSEEDWMDLAKYGRAGELGSDTEARRMFKEVRRRAKLRFGTKLFRALQEFWKANEGRLPTDVAQLAPHFDEPVPHSMLARYEMVKQGNIADVKTDEVMLKERTPADLEFDTWLRFVSTNKITTE